MAINLSALTGGSSSGSTGGGSLANSFKTFYSKENFFTDIQGSFWVKTGYRYFSVQSSYFPEANFRWSNPYYNGNNINQNVVLPGPVKGAVYLTNWWQNDRKVVTCDGSTLYGYNDYTSTSFDGTPTVSVSLGISDIIDIAYIPSNHNIAIARSNGVVQIHEWDWGANFFKSTPDQTLDVVAAFSGFNALTGVTAYYDSNANEYKLLIIDASNSVDNSIKAVYAWDIGLESESLTTPPGDIHFNNHDITSIYTIDSRIYLVDNDGRYSAWEFDNTENQWQFKTYVDWSYSFNYLLINDDNIPLGILGPSHPTAQNQAVLYTNIDLGVDFGTSNSYTDPVTGENIYICLGTESNS